ncbi:hypothetical protein PMAYCL1PPCAC_03750, partial [Pristionchus mayeri]
ELCATARCPPNTNFVEVKEDRRLGESLAGESELSCTNEGKWRTSDGSKTFSFVMCQRPCPGRCKDKPFETDRFYGTLQKAIPAFRDECSYSCPEGKSMFYNNVFGVSA